MANIGQRTEISFRRPKQSLSRAYMGAIGRPKAFEGMQWIAALPNANANFPRPAATFMAVRWQNQPSNTFE